MRTVRHLASLLVLLWAWTAHAQIAVTRVAANTSTGNQDLTAAGVTWTPVAAVLLVSYATTDATAADHGLIATGFTDCTNSATAQGRSQHNANPTSTVVRTHTTLLQIVNTSNTTLDAEGALVGCITGGVRINWTDAPGAAYLLHLVLFGSATVSNAAAGTFASQSTIGNATDVTAPGFTPHDVLLSMARVNTGNTTSSEMRGCLGVGNATAQGSIGWQDFNNVSTTLVVSGTSSTYACQGASGNAFQTQSAQELGSFDASGFSSTTRTAAGGYLVTYLALRYQSGISSWTGVVSTPTSPQAVSYSSVGFLPGFVLLLQSGSDTINVGKISADAGYTGVSLLTSTAQYAMSRAAVDAQATPSNTQSLSDDQAIQLPGPSGSTLFTGTLDTFHSTGFTLDFTATDSMARQWYAWAISGGAAPGATARRGYAWW